MMNFTETKLESDRRARSLVWQGDDLIDWVGGGTRYSLDGIVVRPQINYAGDFDAAIATGDGDIAVLYKRLGTKAIVLKNGQIIRELNRSFYHAHVYEYPICLWERPGQPTMIIHCPDDYNRLELEDTVSGQRLVASDKRNSPDFFHSRLSTNPSGTLLISAGWVWHPWNCANIYRLPSNDEAIELDTPYATVETTNEVSSCAWATDDMVLAANSEKGKSEEEDEVFTPGALGCWSVSKKQWSRVTVPDTTLGQLMPVGDDHVVSFFEHPKLIRLSDGVIVNAWPHISSGTQTSSIIWHRDPLPPIAIDSAARRFAVVNDTRIHVVRFD